MSDSTLPGWVVEHIEMYLRTDGEEGHIWRGVPTLLLTTTGRHSGEQRLLPLIYGEDGNNFVIIASKGGHTDHPSWYLNLAAEPKVHVQVGAEKFIARAETVDGPERQSLWDSMVEIWTPYTEYQEKTDRLIPVVRLVRA